MSAELETSRAPARTDMWIAAALFVGTVLVLWATEAAQGYPRDESFYFYAAENFARWFELLLHAPAQALSDAATSRYLDYNHEHPMLAKELFGLSYLVFGKWLGWLRPATAFRLPAFAIAATIPAVLHLYGSTLYSRRAGLFAALCFYAVPRHFFHAHLSAFDIPIAAAWLWVVYLFWRAMTDRWMWIACGFAFGLAVAIKHNAWFLPFALAPFSLARGLALTRGRPELRRWIGAFFGVLVAFGVLMGLVFLGLGPDRFLEHFGLLSPQSALIAGLWIAIGWILWRLSSADLGSGLPRAGLAFRAVAPLGAMIVGGPAVFYLHWPYLWYHPVDRTAWYLAFHAEHVNYAWTYLGTVLREPPFPLFYVFVVTALTLPISLLLPMTTGLLALAGRCALGFTRRFDAWRPSSGELLVGMNALASILIISHPDVPHFGGVKHWIASVIFLALLAGQAVDRACAGLEDAVAVLRLRRSGPPGSLTASHLPSAAAGTAMFALLLAPAALATAHVHPYGTAAYGELAGGLPGAATLGMQRQYWSNNVSGVLPWINTHAPPGARVWLHEVTELAFRAYQQNGMLRADLQPAQGPEDAQIAAYQYHQEFREQEMAIWQAFGTQKPVFGLYLNETPQIVVYQRP